MELQCSKCRFWERLTCDDENPIGVCHRHPPALSDHALRFYAENLDEDDVREERDEDERLWKARWSLDVWMQPITSGDDDWCGEFQQRESVDNPEQN